MKSPIPVRFYHEAKAPSPLEAQPPLGIIIVPDGESRFANAYWITTEGVAKLIRSRQVAWSNAINNEILSVDGRYFLTTNLTSVRLPLMLHGEDFLVRPFHKVTWDQLAAITFVPSAGWTMDLFPSTGYGVARVIADANIKHYYIFLEDYIPISAGFDSGGLTFDHDKSIVTWDRDIA